MAASPELAGERDLDAVIAVDVGTQSARAALFTLDGARAGGPHVAPFPTHNPCPDYYEQSSDAIWAAVSATVRGAVHDATRRALRVIGLAFDATCSLVVLDTDMRPLSVSLDAPHPLPDAHPVWNIVAWLDHRATAEAEYINQVARGSPVLSRFGGAIFVENEPPKLLWLKRNLKTWTRAAHFFDLADFLTFRATGSPHRGQCATACKWGRAPEGWDADFWRDIGLDDLLPARIDDPHGLPVLAPGEAATGGLCAHVAEEWGLSPGIAVAAGMVDAHAGGVGMLGVAPLCELEPPLTSRLAMICGTSTCHLMTSRAPVYVPGVWGPFYNATLPGMFLAEGGQSATGILLEHIITSSSLCDQVSALAARNGTSRHEVLAEKFQHMASESGLRPTQHVHVLPYFHGNRAPRADPTLRGVISGLTLSNTLEDLAIHYAATVEALVYGARHLMNALESAGHDTIELIYVCGGLSKSSFFVQTLADGTGVPVALLAESEAVLLGTAMCAAVAAGAHEADLAKASQAMSSVDSVIRPSLDSSLREFHERKYKVFLRMYDHFMELRKMME